MWRIMYLHVLIIKYNFDINIMRQWNITLKTNVEPVIL